MGFSSLHVCMESSSDHWLQGTIEEESSGGMDSSPSPSPSPISISSSSAVGAGDMNMIACSTIRPMMMTERKLRPPQDQLALKCPRCDSTHTKFCYYNNYSLSQPRYFCKACRRYWTKGGTLRNIPVGGGCRKNRKVSSSKKSNNNNNNNNNNDINNNNNTAAAVGPSYPSNFLDVQFPHHHHIINNLLIGSSTNAGALMENNPDFMVESKYNNMGMMIRSSSRNLDLFGVGDNVMMSGYNNNSNGNNNNINVLQSPNNYLGFCSSSAAAFGGLSLIDGNNMMESCHQRLMFPYGSSSCDNDEQFNNNSLIDVKPNPRVLSLEWQDNMMQGGCSDGKETFGCIDGPGSWNNGVINGYGSSATNPLV